MASQPVSLVRLGTEPAFVKCLACQKTGNTVRPMEMISQAAAHGFTCLSLLGIIVCRCDFLVAPTYYFLEHFCSHCGIRLAILPWQGEPLVQIDKDCLAPTENSGDKSTGTFFALSPVGPPPSLVTDASIRDFVSRYISTYPVITLEVQHSSWSKFPTAVLNKERTAELFNITRHGMSGDGRVITEEYSANEHMTSSVDETNLGPSLRRGSFWDPARSKPHICVSDATTEIPIATVQLFTNNGDFVLHTPEYDTNTEGKTLTYSSRRTGIGHSPTKRPAFLLWHSSFGPLLWVVRQVQTGNMKSPSRRAVLLDAYNRLVAVLDKSEGMSTDADGKPIKLLMVRFDIYVEAPQVLLGEVLASYSALRYIHWNWDSLGIFMGGLSPDISAVYPEEME
ncbi:unnamed protein product [Clonostachys rosea]|uniref:LITAF domain-containing protein n=1 Tax=Bionectria ochroleuca TaxID=29856 RepID=A0ABY6UI89_BIOOC|nr:unnamed protein product [Clonostachys rosea]